MMSVHLVSQFLWNFIFFIWGWDALAKVKEGFEKEKIPRTQRNPNLQVPVVIIPHRRNRTCTYLYFDDKVAFIPNGHLCRVYDNILTF